MHIHVGIINRGDSFRRKRSRSNSLANSPMSPNQSPSMSQSSRSFVTSYRVHMLGGPGVGKTALLEQFSTSENIDAYDDKGLYNSCVRAEASSDATHSQCVRWGDLAAVGQRRLIVGTTSTLNQSTAIAMPLPISYAEWCKHILTNIFAFFLHANHIRCGLRPIHRNKSMPIEPAVEQTVKVILNGAESELKFVTGQKGSKVTFTLYSRINIHSLAPTNER